MKSNKSDWVKNPTKKQVVFTIFIWLTGLSLITLSVTNFFTESPLQKKYLGSGLLLLMATFTLFRVCRNYFKNHLKKIV